MPGLSRTVLPSDQPATRVLPGPGRTVLARVRRYRLTISGGPGRTTRVEEVGSAELRIGSRAGAGLVVDDPAVSRVHIAITADAHGFRIRDLGSTNGTEVDGTR